MQKNRKLVKRVKLFISNYERCGDDEGRRRLIKRVGDDLLIYILNNHSNTNLNISPGLVKNILECISQDEKRMNAMANSIKSTEKFMMTFDTTGINCTLEEMKKIYNLIEMVANKIVARRMLEEALNIIKAKKVKIDVKLVVILNGANNAQLLANTYRDEGKQNVKILANTHQLKCSRVGELLKEILDKN